MFKVIDGLQFQEASMNASKLADLARGVEPPGYTELTSALKEIAKPFGSSFPFCQRASLYELYTREYIAHLAEYLRVEWDGKRILEICAGDGRLTRFLRQAGVSMLDATDTKDGKDCDFDPTCIEDHVVEFDALEAVGYFNPDLVIVAWPPYGSTIPETILELGVPVIYTGERQGGCCGSEDLWGGLTKNWLVLSIPFAAQIMILVG